MSSSGLYSRRPTGSSPGQKRPASFSSTMTTAQRAGSVALLEEAPPDEPHAHRLEVARRDVHGVGRDQRLARLHRVALGQDHAVVVLVPEGNGVGGAGGHDARQRPHPSQRLVGEGAPRVVVRVAGARGARPRRCSTRSATKPGSTSSTRRKLASSSPAPARSTNVNATWATTRERRRARAPRLPLVARPSSRSTSVRLAESTRASGTSPIPTPIADDRRPHEQHDDAVDPDPGPVGQVLEVERPERPEGDGREDESQHRGDQGQHHALHHELPGHLRAPRAEGQPRDAAPSTARASARGRGSRR